MLLLKRTISLIQNEMDGSQNPSPVRVESPIYYNRCHSFNNFNYFFVQYMTFLTETEIFQNIIDRFGLFLRSNFNSQPVNDPMILENNIETFNTFNFVIVLLSTVDVAFFQIVYANESIENLNSNNSIERKNRQLLIFQALLNTAALISNQFIRPTILVDLESVPTKMSLDSIDRYSFFALLLIPFIRYLAKIEFDDYDNPNFAHRSEFKGSFLLKSYCNSDDICDGNRRAGFIAGLITTGVFLLMYGSKQLLLYNSQKDFISDSEFVSVNGNFPKLSRVCFDCIVTAGIFATFNLTNVFLNEIEHTDDLHLDTVSTIFYFLFYVRRRFSNSYYPTHLYGCNLINDRETNDRQYFKVNDKRVEINDYNSFDTRDFSIATKVLLSRFSECNNVQDEDEVWITRGDIDRYAKSNSFIIVGSLIILYLEVVRSLSLEPDTVIRGSLAVWVILSSLNSLIYEFVVVNDIDKLIDDINQEPVQV